MEFVDLSAHWIWLIAGGVLILLELLTGTTFLLWPGVAAILFAGVVAVASSLSPAFQLVLYAALSLLLTVVGRNYLGVRPGRWTSDRPHLNDRSAQLIGRRVIAAEDFVAGAGAVTVGDTRWNARLDEAQEAAVAAGAALVIKGVDGVQLLVAPAADAS